MPSSVFIIINVVRLSIYFKTNYHNAIYLIKNEVIQHECANLIMIKINCFLKSTPYNITD